MTHQPVDAPAAGPHPARRLIIFLIIAIVILLALGTLAVRYVVLSNYAHDKALHDQRPQAGVSRADYFAAVTDAASIVLPLPSSPSSPVTTTVFARSG